VKHKQVSSRFNRFFSDAIYRRRLLLLLLFLLAFLSEVWLLSIDLPQHKTIVFHTFVSVALILLPFTMVAIVARLPLGQRLVKTRYIIRPFGTLKREPECDGNAIATLLYREIIAWRSSSSRGGIEGRGHEPLASTVSVNLGVTTVPLDWLWTQFRLLITGKQDIIIDGLLLDFEKPFQLRIWTNVSIYTWTLALNSDRALPEALGDVIGTLTPKILESVDPVLAARIQFHLAFKRGVLASSGPGGRRFKSPLPDHFFSATYSHLQKIKTDPLGIGPGARAAGYA
jgi:hypothetical protein